ncbi:unnamed protein product [Pylaiella littoralis]
MESVKATAEKRGSVRTRPSATSVYKERSGRQALLPDFWCLVAEALWQACYDAARSLNVEGMGVQVRRVKCFEKACQALWPGEAPVAQRCAAAFSEDNVQAESDTEGDGDDASKEPGPED